MHSAHTNHHNIPENSSNLVNTKSQQLVRHKKINVHDVQCLQLAVHGVQKQTVSVYNSWWLYDTIVGI